MRFMPLLFFFWVWKAIASPQVISFSGETMGSYFMVRYLPVSSTNTSIVETQVFALLQAIDARLTTYKEDSELLRWNRSRKAGPISVPADVKTLWPVATKVHRLTGGAFDLSVTPLVRLWRDSRESPTEAELQLIRSLVGQDGLNFDASANTLTKKNPETEIDFNAIAPGYAADQVGKWLEEKGIKNYLVDIGGELRARGHRGGNSGWVVGVEEPQEEFGKSMQEKVKLLDQSIATSGSYRKFVERGGERISHFIDPRTGHPTNHSLVSASVVLTDAVSADAWATAMMVLGLQEGLEIARREGIAVLFLEKTGKGNVRAVASPEWEKIRSSELGFASSLVVTLLFFFGIVSAMAIGVMFNRRPLQGSCGGLAQVMGEQGCEICEKKERCEKTGRRIIVEKSKS